MQSKKHSNTTRSEIEKNLSSRSHVPKKRTRSFNSNTTKNNTPEDITKTDSIEIVPRQQLVLGGDLSGISKNTKRDFISRYFRAHIINSIAIVIVVLIAIAFFWPQKKNSIKEIAEIAKPVEVKSFYNQSRLDQPQSPPSVQGFSRKTDTDRAERYRIQDALELKIRNLLAQAQTYSDNQAFTSPKGENAFETYQAVLKLDQKNVAARRSIEYMRGRLLEAGYGALKSSNLALANSTLAEIAIIDDSSPEYDDLNNAISRYQIRVKTASLLRRAEQSLQNGNLLLPARANALYFYQQVLQINEQNEEAQTGIQKIADLYIDKATEQVALGNYQQAVSHVATVTVIDPEHPQISRMQGVIESAQQISANLRASNPTTDQLSATNPVSSETQQPSNSKTPAKEASEQAVFDNEYLKQGLQAYSDKRYTDAISLLQPLADKGISRAQHKVGYMLFYGRGVSRDRRTGVAIIQKALPALTRFANEGRLWAQVDLGELYQNGIGVQRDISESIFWYRLAADKGYPQAQTKMGNAYRRGRGVTSNRRTAVEWFQRAAKQGDQEAVRSLRQMGISAQ